MRRLAICDGDRTRGFATSYRSSAERDVSLIMFHRRKPQTLRSRLDFETQQRPRAEKRRRSLLHHALAPLGALVYWTEHHQPDRSLRTQGHLRAYNGVAKPPTRHRLWCAGPNTRRRRRARESSCCRLTVLRSNHARIQAPLAKLGLGLESAVASAAGQHTGLEKCRFN